MKINLVGSVFAGIAVVFLSLTAGADTLPSYCYAQEALVGHWDALDNVGTGTMDIDSTVWKDLSGNGLDLMLMANGEWNADGYLNAKAKASYGAAVADAAAPNFTTMEVVFRNNNSTYSWNPTVFYSGSNSKILNMSTSSKTIYFSNTSGQTLAFDSALLRDITVSRVFSTAAYVDGVEDTAGTTGTGSGGWNVTSKMMFGGSSTAAYYAGFGGRLYAVRLYDRPLTSGELVENSVIDSVRFFGVTEPDFIVEGTPYEYGAVSPAYGRVSGFAAETTQTFTAPATAPNASGNASSTCLGWKIYTLNSATGKWENDPNDATKCGPGTTCTYTRPAGCPLEKLVWQWTERKLTATPGDDLAALVATLDNDDTLELPAGLYPITSGTVTLTNSVKIVGAGADVTIAEVSGWNGQAFSIMNSAASVSGITIRNANNDTAGTTGLHGGGVFISGGLVENCVISNCVQKGTKGVAAAGGGFYMTGGTVRNCFITRCTGNKTGSGFTNGDGAYMSGGTVTGCRFEDNLSNGWAEGLAIYCAGGAIEKSVFTRHNGGITVYNAGGTIKNCLVYGNSNTVQNQFSNDHPRFGGVYQTSGRIYNCTICDNSNGPSKTGGSGLRVVGGDAINNIVRDNTATDGTTVSYSFSGSGVFATNLLDSASVHPGNLVGDPLFVDKANGNYYLMTGSPAINTGAKLGAVTDDIDGNVRPFGSAPEIGCYEYTNVASKLTVSMKVSSFDVGAGDSITATAEVDGPDLSGLAYTWYVDGVEQAGGGDSLIVSPAPGAHTLSVTASVVAGAQTDSIEKTVTVYPYTVFVAESGGNVFPYDAPEKAATNVIDAYNALWIAATTTATVHVAEGVYRANTGFDLAEPVHFIGAGSEKTVIDGSDSLVGAFHLANSASLAKGVTVSNFYDRTHAGGGVRMSAGLVEDCRIVKCRGTTMEGGGVYMTDGTLTNCVIRECKIVRSSTGYNRGEGVYMEGGKITCCTFENNATDTQYSNGIGAHITGGTLENCVFTGQNATPLFNAGGTVRNCLVYGNSANIADNSSYRKTGGVYQSAGRIYNCTIVANTNLTKTVGVAPGLRVAGGTAVNNLVWGNVSTDDFNGLNRENNSAVVNTNAADCVVAFGVGNLPLEGRPVKFDCRLRASAANCIDRGDNGIWTDGAPLVDFYGAPRVKSDVIDIGCSEYQPVGLRVLVR